MSDLDNLYARKQNTNLQLASARNQKSAIDAQLSRLETAKKQIIKVKDDVAQLRDNSSKKKNTRDLSWKGKKFEKYENILGNELKNSFNSYYNKVDDVLDAICDKITKLENESRGKGSLIQGLCSAFNNICNEIEKLVN